MAFSLIKSVGIYFSLIYCSWTVTSFFRIWFYLEPAYAQCTMQGWTLELLSQMSLKKTQIPQKMKSYLYKQNQKNGNFHFYLHPHLFKPVVDLCCAIWYMLIFVGGVRCKEQMKKIKYHHQLPRILHSEQKVHPGRQVKLSLPKAVQYTKEPRAPETKQIKEKWDHSSRKCIKKSWQQWH